MEFEALFDEVGGLELLAIWGFDFGRRGKSLGLTICKIRHRFRRCTFSNPRVSALKEIVGISEKQKEGMFFSFINKTRAISFVQGRRVYVKIYNVGISFKFDAYKIRNSYTFLMEDYHKWTRKYLM